MSLFGIAKQNQLQSPVRLRIEALTKKIIEKPFFQKERILRLCSSYAKRVRIGSESGDSCEICATVRQLLRKINPARLPCQVCVFRMRRFQRRAKDDAGPNQRKVAAKKGKTRRSWTEAGPRSFEQKHSRRGLFGFNQTHFWEVSLSYVSGVSASGKEQFQSDLK
jgi:hypothetical protein